MIKDDEFSKSVLESLSSQIKEPVTTDQYADTLAEIGLARSARCVGANN